MDHMVRSVLIVLIHQQVIEDLHLALHICSQIHILPLTCFQIAKKFLLIKCAKITHTNSTLSYSLYF